MFSKIGQMHIDQNDFATWQEIADHFYWAINTAYEMAGNAEEKKIFAKSEDVRERYEMIENSADMQAKSLEKDLEIVNQKINNGSVVFHA